MGQAVLEQDGPVIAHPSPRVRLGEELPIFCERCGYQLHGLPPVRCDHCQVLHFQCPECGYHQPINTLRPAAQRILARARAYALGVSVLFRLVFFGWLLVGWGAMGYEWSYQWDWSGGRGISIQPASITLELILAFSLFGLAFGLVSRLLLLRWRNSTYVGAVLAGLVVLATFAGSYLRYLEYRSPESSLPLTEACVVGILLAAGFIVLGAVMAWPIWSGCVHLFLPRRLAAALLEWQQGLREPDPALART
jgi:hypothetical protein